MIRHSILPAGLWPVIFDELDQAASTD